MLAKLGRHAQIGIILVIILLSLGILFRWVNLDRKVFWVDEVATALRVAGYTKTEVIEALADGTLHRPADLLSYQQLHPDRTWSDSIRAFQQSPEHAPLYFLLVRLWTQIFGSSVVAFRSFSVLCSLLLLAGIYWLSQLLFGFTITGWIAVTLIAISPVFIAYAQEARPYSLWLLLLVLSSGTLLRALQHNTLGSWCLYALTLAMGLYSSLLTLSIAIGQAVYVLVIEQLRLSQRLRRFGVALLSAVTALLPWLWIIAQQWQTLQENTTWMRLPIDNFAKIIIWFYSAAIVYFDVPVITQPRMIAAAEITVASGIVAVIIYAFYALCRQTAQRVWLFVLSLSLPIPFTLVLVDLVCNGRYSTAPRYLLPFHLGSQLSIAYLLFGRLPWGENHFRFCKWHGVALFLVAVSLFSNLIYLEASPRYLKNRNLHNFPIATLINQLDQPLILSEAGNTIDLLSLSHSLESNVKIKILSTAALANQLNSQANRNLFCGDVLLFNPSTELKQQIGSNSAFTLTNRYQPQVLIPTEFSLSLWQIKFTKPAC